ncbi:MAG: 30S ribosomal protein S9 [Patescibacteria group bacterium]
MSEKEIKTKKIIKPKKESEASQKERYFEAVGRRKTSIARVRIYTKKSGFSVNDKDYKKYFPLLRQQQAILAPLEKMKIAEKFGATVKVKGGGVSSQAEAIRLGIARALVKFNAEFKKRLRNAGYITRDARIVERKKYGFRKARRGRQWRKR